MTDGTAAAIPIVATLAGDSEEAKARHRAVRSLLGIAERMTWLRSSDYGREKLLSELGGMSAWVSAFTCYLVGLPIEHAAMPGGELMLASLEVLPRSERLVDARAELPSEGVRADVTDAASRRAALALSLTQLASQLLLGVEGEAPPEGEVAVRHRRAEARLYDRLEEAVQLYFERDLDPDADIAELSCHGFPEGG